MKKIMWMVVFSGFLLDGCACSRGGSVSQQAEEEGAQQPALPPAGPSSPQERLLSIAKENPKATAGAGIGVAGIVGLVVDFIQSKIRGDKMATVKAGQWVGKKAKGIFGKKITVEWVESVDISDPSNLKYTYESNTIPLSYYTNPECLDRVQQAHIPDPAAFGLPTGPANLNLQWTASNGFWLLTTAETITHKNKSGTVWGAETPIPLCQLIVYLDKVVIGPNIGAIAIKNTDAAKLSSIRFLSLGYEWVGTGEVGWVHLKKPVTVTVVQGGGAGGHTIETIADFQTRISAEMKNADGSTKFGYVVQLPDRLKDQNDTDDSTNVWDIGQLTVDERRTKILPAPPADARWKVSLEKNATGLKTTSMRFELARKIL